MSFKDKIQLLFEITCSTTIASVIGYYATDPTYSNVFFISARYFGLLTLITGLLWVFYHNFEFLLWNIKMRLILNSPTIGILYEDKVRPHFTRFRIEDWIKAFEKLGYNAKPINITKINNRYAAIINPYGETYPEEELIELKTFKKIKKFIKNGGLFVNVAGIPFYYGFDFKHDLNPPLSKEQKTYIPKTRGKRKILVEQSVFPPTGYSLVETVAYEQFKILTTWGDTIIRDSYQNDICRKFIGDIANIGNTNKIYEFRAIREQTRKWIPFLITNSEIGKIYPISGITLGRGCLIVCGFNLDIATNHKLWNQRIHEGCFLKIVSAVHNLIQNRKKGAIPLCTNTW